MDELISKIHDLLGTPPAGQELLIAVEATWVKQIPTASRPDLVSSLADSIVSSVAMGKSGGDFSESASDARLAESHQQLIEAAYREIGVSRRMIWALNRSYLYIFQRAWFGDRPERLAGRHPLRDVELLDAGASAGLHGGLGSQALSVAIRRLPVRVAVDRDLLSPFATMLQSLLAAIPAVAPVEELASAPSLLPPALRAVGPVEEVVDEVWDRPDSDVETTYDDLG